MTGYHAKHSKEAYDCCRFKSALISSLGFNYPSISGAKRVMASFEGPHGEVEPGYR